MGWSGRPTKEPRKAARSRRCLSNLMLDVLDKELERRGHRFARYADDCNIYVCSLRAGERVMASVERFLERRLKLKINRAKSAVAPPSQRKFLGFSFTGGATPKRRIAPQALARFKERVRETTRRTRGASLEKIVKDLSRYLIGWRGYFGFCETPSVLRALDQWIRRRLRSIVWKQWKRGRTRFAELRRRGVGIDLAAQTAGSAHGPWRISNSPALAIALPNDLFPKDPRPRFPRGRPSPHNQPNRRVRTRTHGGVGGEGPRGSPLSRFGARPQPSSKGGGQACEELRAQASEAWPSATDLPTSITGMILDSTHGLKSVITTVGVRV